MRPVQNNQYFEILTKANSKLRTKAVCTNRYTSLKTLPHSCRYAKMKVSTRGETLSANQKHKKINSREQRLVYSLDLFTNRWWG